MVRIIVLDFAFAEFVNVIWKKLRRDQITAMEADEMLGGLLEISPRIEIEPARDHLQSRGFGEQIIRRFSP